MAKKTSFFEKIQLVVSGNSLVDLLPVRDDLADGVIRASGNDDTWEILLRHGSA